ncbi:hypothetical protein GJ698_22225 [Pseudoduganella sp. FT26W]|uniref:Uncharacterized protein n=1 Tax=Duganella aquatilis TaxID=2666082 RepID=A0A844DCM0_9BURK|nr:hypothetical protein [Duganella aquatilis]MRW86792.1 hypothetical protein [Duganella aquatilis]
MHQSTKPDRASRQIAMLSAIGEPIEIKIALCTKLPYYVECVRMNKAALYLGATHDDLVPGQWHTVVTFYINDFDEWLAAHRELAHQALLKSYQKLSLLDARMARSKQR